MYHAGMSSGRDELKTLSFAFKAYGSKKIGSPHITNIEKPAKQYVCMREVLLHSLTSFSQFVHKVMDRSNSICTRSPQVIPNHSPYKFRPIFLEVSSTQMRNSSEIRTFYVRVVKYHSTKMVDKGKTERGWNANKVVCTEINTSTDLLPATAPNNTWKKTYEVSPIEVNILGLIFS